MLKKKGQYVYESVKYEDFDDEMKILYNKIKSNEWINIDEKIISICCYYD